MNSKLLIFSSLKIFLPLLVAILIVASLILNAKNESELELYKGIETNSVEVIIEKIDTELSSLIADLKIITSLNELSNYLEKDDNEVHKKEMEAIFSNLMAHRKSYDQIRILDEKGLEVVRVNYNNGKPNVTTSQELQNKKGRYYFDDAFALEEGMIFISPLDLNIEHGVIEQPLKPMIRIATPLFDSKGNKRGICLLNYLGKNIIDQAKNVSNIDIEHHIMLLNSDSYWLKCDHPANEWGFMYPDKKDVKFSQIYPQEWDRILQQDAIQLISKNGLFSSETVYPLRHWSDEESERINITDQEWKVVSYIPTYALYEQRNLRYKVTGAIVLILFIISYLMSITIANSRQRSNIANQKLKESERYLRESNATKDRFFSIIAHDLRSPFNSVLGLSSLIVKNYNQISEDKIKLYIQSINKELSKTYALLENLLSWSRSQRNAITINKDIINLHLVVEETLEVLKPSANKKSIGLMNNIKVETHVNTDKELITTIIRNLVSNAIKFTPEHGTITISTKESSPNKYQIEVSDTGVGMSEEVQNKLFKIGENVSTPGTNNENGTGLGLIVCKEFVEKLGGHIGVHSELKQGSTFYFTIEQ